MKHCLASFLIFLSLSAPAFADEPLRRPQLHTVCSPSAAFCATSDPDKDLTFVSSQASDEVLWSIPGWHRWLFVANDGESVVAGYSGMNLVPLDVSLEEPVLFFYNHGRLVREVTLGEFYQSKSQLRRTASHLTWGHILGFNNSDQLVVELVDGRKVMFTAKNGKIVTGRANGT